MSSPKGRVPGREPWRKPVGRPPLLGHHCGHQVWLERHLPLRTAAPNSRGFGKRSADLCLDFGCCLAVPCGAVLPMGLTRQWARVAGLQIGVSAGCRLATPQAWGHPAALICPERAVEHFLQPHPLCHARQGWACNAACLEPAAESSSDPVHLLRSLIPHSCQVPRVREFAFSGASCFHRKAESFVFPVATFLFSLAHRTHPVY